MLVHSLKKDISIFLFILIFTPFSHAEGFSPPVTSVTVDETKSKESVNESVQLLADPQLAMSVPNYPVTAGDVYSLAFAAGATPVHYTIPVDTSYKIRVANLGVIKCAGLTYNQLKVQVEYLVSQNYPMAGTQFVLQNPAVFLVSIVGEVRTASERKAWALTRLSAFIASSMTSYSSNRSVTVISADGKKRIYDLFKASRSGDFSQNPYLRPGDKIFVGRCDRKVSISGSVERPGVYELLDGENLRDLVFSYASNATKTANLSKIQLVRICDEDIVLEKVLYLSEADLENNFVLNDKDRIFIPDWSVQQPVVEIKGIIKNPLTMKSDSDIHAIESDKMYKTKIHFYIEESYASLIRRIRNMFTDFSDLAEMYVEREDVTFKLDADKILEDFDFESPYKVEKNDVIIVPYLPMFAN
ncbi:SLBB domain-containing protein [uncultured Treponema sp.]|uniref:SLBB domain-containing protein n=1 Tax=uncultured Treponema sp. TaxID=162155 RepID=UPI0025D4827D|nr:SLBB domain-containing protein [uncultured Treponema sp.]